jgi:uncharacterized protein DUF2213
VTKLKSNCKGKAKCACGGGLKSRSFRVRLTPSETRRTKWNGRDMMIVPVVMARGNVVMNGSLFPEEEMLPETWDGVPVTVGHPSDGDGFVSANQPDVLSDWAVGRIFHATVEAGKLKAEAWIDVEDAERVAPGLIESIESGEPMDVSTGYFSTPEKASGEIDGKIYEDIDRAVRPNHLALLPNEEGACNWADGCGVRANKRRMTLDIDKAVDGLKAAINRAMRGNAKAPAKKKNERGPDGDARQIVADLISREESPFLPDDEAALRSLSAETLKKMRDFHLTSSEEGEEEEEPETQQDETTEEETPEGNADGDEGDDEEKPVGNRKKGRVMTKGKTKPVLATFSKEDQEALTLARRHRDEHRAKLIDKITGNTTMTKEQLASFDVNQLETIAGGIRPEANYSGRALPQSDDATDSAKAMIVPNVSDQIKARGKKGA